jgi:hypothetical protein
MLLFKVRDQILYLYTTGITNCTLKFKIQDSRPPKFHSLHNIRSNEEVCGKKKKQMLRYVSKLLNIRRGLQDRLPELQQLQQHQRRRDGARGGRKERAVGRQLLTDWGT